MQNAHIGLNAHCASRFQLDGMENYRVYFRWVLPKLAVQHHYWTALTTVCLNILFQLHLLSLSLFSLSQVALAQYMQNPVLIFLQMYTWIAT